MMCNKGNSTWRKKNLTLFLKKDLIINQRVSVCLVMRLSFKREETWAPEEGDFKALCAWVLSTRDHVFFLLRLLIWQVIKSRASFRTMSLMIEGPIFTQKCDPNCTPHTHQTDIFLTQKNNTAVHIKIFYKCAFRGKTSEWKQYTDRSNITACVSGSLVLSGFDSVVLGYLLLGKIRVRISDLILNSSVFDKGPFYIWFQTIGYKEKSWNVFPEMMISSLIGHAHLSTAAYSMLMPGLWGCYMSLTFSGISTQAAFLNVLAHFLCSSVGDDKEIKISCLIFWSKWIFFYSQMKFSFNSQLTEPFTVLTGELKIHINYLWKRLFICNAECLRVYGSGWALGISLHGDHSP